MKKTIRQSMAWFHSWIGLTLGWLLFAIFLMGSLSYYKNEISFWMQPHFATQQVEQNNAIQHAFEYLEKNAADAKSWHISIADQLSPVNQIYWQKNDGTFERKTLDANTNAEIKASSTMGGDFFYNFHFQLYGMPYLIGRLIITFAAIVMLITLISGVITHKKIFVDFFTLRTFKSQRSYLDFHNISSVIALPFFFTMTFTGIAIFFYIIFPSGMKKLYPENPFQYFTEIRTVSAVENTPTQIIAMKKPEDYLSETYKRWGVTELGQISIQYPNTELAKITIAEKEDRSISYYPAQISFNGATGEIIEDNRNRSTIGILYASMYGLHLGHFASPLLKLTLFFSGILGCLMIASGLLLWSLKREIQNKTQQFNFGHYLVNRLNVSTFIGLPIAILSYLYANRIGGLFASNVNYEILIFFAAWLTIFTMSLGIQKHSLWKTFLKIFVTMAIILPILNLFILINRHYISDLNQYWSFLRIDLLVLFFALFGYLLHQKIVPIQTKFNHKLALKVNQQKKQQIDQAVTQHSAQQPDQDNT